MSHALMPCLGLWTRTSKGDPQLRAMYLRHYSSEKRPDHADPLQFVGPGTCLCLISADGTAGFVWRQFFSKDKRFGHGVNCAMFRNEGRARSSDLIREAVEWAWSRVPWAGQRLYTYVKPKRVKSSNPGYCFIKAGWSPCGSTKSGLRVLEIMPGRAAA